MNLKPITKSAGLTAQERFALLSATGRALLSMLANMVPTGMSTLTITQSQMATAIGRSTRTVQNTLKTFEATSLMVPTKSKNRFSATRVEFETPALVELIKKNHEQLQSGVKVTPPSIFTRSSTRFPFRWLKDPQRFATLEEDLAAAMLTAPAYWEWIETGCMALGATLPVRVVGQKRRMTDGERGGQLPCWGGTFANTKNAAYELQTSARSAAKWRTEATFNIPLEHHPLLLVDDVSLEALCKLPAACAVIETSPGNFQATVMAPRRLTMQERMFAQFALIKLVDGDPGANSSNQLRRFPGSLNNKPAMKKVFISKVHHLSVDHTIPVELLDHLIANGKSQAKISAAKNLLGQTAAAAPDQAAHAHDLYQQAGPMTVPMDTPLTGRKGHTDQSQSGIDFRYACVELRRGTSESSVVSAIATRAGQRKKNGKPMGDGAHVVYAQRTVKNAKSRMVGTNGARLIFKAIKVGNNTGNNWAEPETH